MPIDEYLPYSIRGLEQRRTGHPFVGRFTKQVTLAIDSGTMTLMVEAENAIGNYGYDSIDLMFDLTLDGGGNVVDATLLSVEQNESTEPGLFQPLWGKIRDSSLTTEDIADARVELRTSSQTIDEIDIVEHPETGYYYTRTPVIALAKPFLDESLNAPNVIQVFDNQLTTRLAYYSPIEAGRTAQGGLTANNASSTTQMNWGFTAASPPNYLTYAEGTSVSIDWYSELLELDKFEITRVNVLRRGRRFFGWFPTAWQSATNVELLGDPKTGSTLSEQTSAGSTLKGKSFKLKIGVGGKTMPEKALKVHYTFTNDEDNPEVGQSDLVRFRVDTFKTIVLAVDGLAYDTAMELIDKKQSEEPGGTFAQIFSADKTMGLGLIDKSEIALSALPTITWANWPGVFGGGSPSEHGITGNSFFRRELANSIPTFSGGASGIYNYLVKLGQQVPVANSGAMNGLATDDAGSIYDQIALGMDKTGGDKERLQAISVRPFYTVASKDMVSVKSIHFPLSLKLTKHDWKAAELLDDGYPEESCVYPRVIQRDT